MRLDAAKWDPLLGTMNDWECIDLDTGQVLKWAISIDSDDRIMTQYARNKDGQLMFNESRTALLVEKVELAEVNINVDWKQVTVRVRRKR